ncbi:MAG: FtsX-like permease family protein [Thermoleophilia bacterium]|nr:FtsX-like permease family protein [Thermoleophilia bacterium]
MDSFTRGVRNAFRNYIRTTSVVIILAISIGLALIMLISLFAVNDRIDSVRASVGTTITVAPAGIRGFQGGGELLTESDADTVSSLDHVASVEQSFTSRLTTDTDTTLQSAIDPGSFGQQNSGSSGQSGGAQMSPPPGASGMGGATMTLPVMVNGVQDNASLQSLGMDKLDIVSGEGLASTTEDNVALVGSQLATKNNLQPGSTFTAFDTQIKVVGIFDSGNQFSNSSLLMPIDTLRKLASSEGQINSMVVTADSSANVQAVTDSIKSEMGSKVDVVSQLDATSQALSSLEGVKSITRYSLAGALISASVILFLIMLMIVRERRQEIGVLKAIGASNVKIMKQFISESLTFTLMSAVVGTVLGFAFSNPVLNILINSSSSQTTQVAQGAFRGGPQGGPPGGGAPPGAGGPGRQVVSASQSALENLNAVLDYRLLVYGLMAALLIAVIGSSIPAWTIARIRPAEAMSGE